MMIVALTLLMASKIISIQEGLAGFANEGLLTVLVLFVVAAGISHTGALDWYMGKLLGRPNNTASEQLRLMLPIAVISAFLNNTPVVAVMIPIVQRWGKNVGVSPQQLLIPLSFASILGKIRNRNQNSNKAQTHSIQQPFRWYMYADWY